MKRILAITGLAVMGGLLFAAGLLALPPHATPSAAAGATIGGPFQLLDGDGRTVTDRSFRGRWTPIYFGYTHCPDACPTALQDMANALDLLGPQAAPKLAVVFITVGPERDTPAVMEDYVAGFSAGIVALPGPRDAIAAAERG